MIPPLSDGRTYFGVDMRRRQAASAAPMAPSSGSRAWPRRLLVALAFSVIAGGAAGWVYGGATGVREGVAAGARLGATLVTESASGTAEAETARLLAEVRGLRAQFEQFRHAVETQRTGDQTSAIAARLQDISARLERLERASGDSAPVGSLKKPASAGDPRRPQKAIAH